VLVLDEPTNDLDIETLELLESHLIEWPGTLLLVSHDRAFIDHVVTSTLVFEGRGRVQEFVGGYEDWLRQKSPEAAEIVNRKSSRAAPGSVAGSALLPRKLSFKERREFDELPAHIERLETEQTELQTAISRPDFYKEAAADIARTLARLEELKDALHRAYARWDELDSRSKG
jgi:ATP-binding cassette subfamily F protein uup